MPRPSPQTDRVVAVIELLAATERGATMTEIARALAVNQASCVHMLAALASAGVVVREPDRRYHLGPALVRPGRIAAERYPVLAAARTEMTALSSGLGLLCFAFAPEADHARLVHYTFPPTQAVPTVRLGEPVPLTPPLGIVFVAWGPDAGFDEWLALAPDMDAGQADHYREHRRAIRELGFVVETAPTPTSPADLAQVMDDRASPRRDTELHRLLTGPRGDAYLLTDLADVGPRSVTGIGAPVFDTRGVAVLSLNVVNFPGPLTPGQIVEVGSTVRAATDRVTAAIGGAVPEVG
ncbi:MAG: IclR family transcriptional regulator [Acidimicrobiales bacterium]